ncbi:MAG: MucR family transcriptional regulator [Rhodobacterales bacterium]|nr:MucR family transcriptional regulator [Rhodobacterales bacterium]
MSEENIEQLTRDDILRMAVDVVAAYVAQNSVPAAELPDVIQTVYGTLDNLNGAPAEAPAEPQKPAVPVRRSVADDHIVCLEDGKKLKMLKRHLRTTYDMTPEEYRAKWNLPPDYPMVAPAYAKQRSEFAKKIGLGRKPDEAKKKPVARRAPRKK